MSTINYRTLDEHERHDYAGVENADTARVLELQVDGCDAILIAEPHTCQIHGIDASGETFGYAIFDDNADGWRDGVEGYIAGRKVLQRMRAGEPITDGWLQREAGFNPY